MTITRTQLDAERSGATRARLLRHARRVFEERGYGAASVADIVTAAGVARGTFYVHFTSKREVFIAIVSTVRDDLVEAQMRPIEGSTTVAGAIRNAIEQYLRAYETSARMLSLIEEVSISDEVVRAAWLETRDALLGNTTHALDRLRDRGLAHFEGSSKMLALTIGGMVERMGANRYMLGYQFDDDEFFRVITDAYVHAGCIVGDYQLRPREDLIGPASAAVTAPARRPRPVR